MPGAFLTALLLMMRWLYIGIFFWTVVVPLMLPSLLLLYLFGLL